MLSRLFLVLFLAFSAGAVFAQHSQTIESIRVIGNRRIPKETILARMFTHPGDTYDPVSIERDFNSLWNTGYFEDLRIEREDTRKGHHPRRLRHGKPHHPRDQLQGQQFRLYLRHPRPLQEGKGRPLRRKPVRPHQDQARRDGSQGTACRARPPVRHHQDRRQDHSSGFGADQLQHQGRPDRQSRRDQVRRQPAHQQPPAAPLDEEPQARRHSLFDHL